MRKLEELQPEVPSFLGEAPWSSVGLMVKALAAAGPGQARQAFLERVGAYAEDPSEANGLRVEAALVALRRDGRSSEVPGTRAGSGRAFRR